MLDKIKETRMYKSVIQFCSMIKNKIHTFWMNNKSWIINVLLVIVLLVPVIAYCLKFCGGNISDDADDWGNFGDYLSGTYGVILTLVAIYISYSLQDVTEKRNNKHRRAENLYTQITQIGSSPKSEKEWEELVENIQIASLDLPELLTEKLLGLADNYLNHVCNGDYINRELEKSILEELKSIYND